MLTQFRIRYPQGSLTSELIEIDRGQYIVRAEVQVNDITLASGMAAAETVELAEDRARERALAILGLDLNVATKTDKKPTTSKQETATKTNSNSTVKNNSLLDLAPPQPTEANIPSSDLSAARESQPEIPSQINNNYPQQESNAPGDRESIELVMDIPPDEDEAQVTIDPDLLSEIPDEIHIDEVIKETDFHMKRLGWTKQQGRTYLKETYGKNSRHVLDDKELWEFLQYLKRQPDPK